MILVSFHWVRKRLNLLALASTVPFNGPRAESLRHKKGNGDHIVFRETYLYIEEAREVSASVFTLASAIGAVPFIIARHLGWSPDSN